MRVQGKTAIVTGAGAGFGRGIALRFAEEGAAVIVNDIDSQAGEAVVEEVKAAGGQAHFIASDIATSAGVKALVSLANRIYGGLDIMVNNAGVPMRAMPMTDLDEESYDRIFNVNVKSIYWSAIHALPVLRRRGGGVIINTASTAALRPRPNLVWYNGSKGAVTAITKSMAVELGPENIRVNALCPVAGETQMLAEFMGGEATAEMRAKFAATVPMGRLCQPIDMANAALYLASDEAGFITGVCLEVDGGRCI